MSEKKKIKIKVDSKNVKNDPENPEVIEKNKETSKDAENTAGEVATEDPIKELEAKLNATREEAK